MSLSQWTRVHFISICDFSLFFHYQFLVVYHHRWKGLVNRISVIQRLLSLLWVLTDYLPQRMPCVCVWTISIPLLLNGIQYMSVSPFGLKNSSDPMVPYWFFIQIFCSLLKWNIKSSTVIILPLSSPFGSVNIYFIYLRVLLLYKWRLNLLIHFLFLNITEPPFMSQFLA